MVNNVMRLSALLLSGLFIAGCTEMPASTPSAVTTERPAPQPAASSNDPNRALASFVNFSGQPLTEDNIALAMAYGCPPSEGCGRGVGRDTAASAAALATPTTTSFDQIEFDFNSDRLTPRALNALVVISGAMKRPELRELKFVIEGHTDAKGNWYYNRDLSKRRADSVMRFLVDTQKIEFNRLTTVGKGSTDLLDKVHPESGVNRRVAFVRQ